MTQAGMVVWVDALSDLSDDEFRLCLARFIRESTEFPTIAAVRRFAGPKGMPDESRAASAWGEVIQAIRSQGAYATVDFADRIINAVIREMGGWVALCDTPSPELMVWTRKRFEELYAVVAKSGVGDSSPLSGIEATTNSRLGYDGPSPEPVGGRLPSHPVAKRLERVEAQPKRIEASPAVRTVVEGFGQTEPREPEQPREQPTDEEFQARAKEQAEQLAAWAKDQEQAESSFRAACREVA